MTFSLKYDKMVTSDDSERKGFMKKRTKWVLAAVLAVALAIGAYFLFRHEHSFGNWKETMKATCTQEGLLVRTCQCGEKETRTAAKDPHTYIEQITREATCVAEGARTLTCSACQEVRTEIIPKGSHKYQETVTKEPSCGKDGIKTFTCQCGDSYTEAIPSVVYSSTEIGEKYANSVGEVVVSDQNGQAFSLGTCLVYEADGKLITNYHVIELGYSAKVTIGGSTYDVTKVLAYDKTLDLAVLEINAQNLQPVLLCREDHKLGETVYAYGSSQGLTGTLSSGMISAEPRIIDGVKYVQHSAPISQGNSGGPLISSYGEVIGINTWTIRESQNLNFAIHLSELDKLDFSKPMTMEQFYQKECNAYARLKKHIIANGTQEEDGSGYTLRLGSDHSEGGNTYMRQLRYHADTELISLDCLIDYEFLVSVYIDSEVSGIYKWYYVDTDDYIMSGDLYAQSFAEGATLFYREHNISNYNTVTAVQNLASSMIHYLCGYMNTDFAIIGLTAADLKFIYY